MRAFVNPAVRRDSAFRGMFSDAEYREVHAYYAAHPQLVPTPLRSLDARAADAGLASIYVKDESARDGVNAFKIVGVRFAVHMLGDRTASRGLVCATAGNHGRAVARVARDKHVPCTVFVPAPRRTGAHDIELRIRASRVAAMHDDGAAVVEVEGSYEEAVRQAAAFGARTGATVVSDTSWPGYEEIPRWIMAGYTQVFEEAYAQWDHRPDVIAVQGGVGGLVCAAVSWAAWRFGADRPAVIACEPDGAACLLASAAAGQAVALEGPLDTFMAGLRCGEPSSAAWPVIRDGVDAFVSVPDSLVLEAIGGLRTPSGGDARIAAGPSGACGAAALLALMHAPELRDVVGALRLTRSTRGLAVVTEGP